jgi:hypothetical protein
MYFSLIAVVLILMNTFFLTQSRDLIFKSKQTFLQTQAFTIAKQLSDAFALTIENVSQVMSALDVAGSTHIKIIGVDGNALYKSTDGDAWDGSFISENIAKAISGYDVFYAKFSNGAFSSSALTPVNNKEGAVIGVVYVNELDTEQGAILLGLQATIQNISFVIALLSIIMVAFVTWTITHGSLHPESHRLGARGRIQL